MNITKKALRIMLALMIAALVLCSCDSKSEMIDSEAYPVESSHSEIDEPRADDSSTFNSRYEPSEDTRTVAHLKSLEEIISLCPQLSGSWRCGRHITTAKLFGNNVEAIYYLLDSDGFNVEFSTTGIMICGNKYALHFPWTTANMYIKNAAYSALWDAMGHPQGEKLPLNRLGSDTYDYFDLFIQNTNETVGEERDFQSILICMYEDNKLLLSIDNVVFIAERETDH